MIRSTSRRHVIPCVPQRDVFYYFEYVVSCQIYCTPLCNCPWVRDSNTRYDVITQKTFNAQQKIHKKMHTGTPMTCIVVAFIVMLNLMTHAQANECLCTRGAAQYYGKFCGFGYSDTPSELPCDWVDSCCAVHDSCVEVRGMLNCECHRMIVCCLESGLLEQRQSNCTHAVVAANNLMADIMTAFSHCYITPN